ncbi:DUF58 domain-containing protein [Proteiniborus sp.]|uniref:DUF58 domain-containing protein n=1 Tax=Proteiniborus sp. TaxID=2079015 RepID=UPI00332FD0A0
MNRLKVASLLLFLILLSFALLVGGTMPYFLFYIFLLTFFIPLIHSLITLIGLKGYVRIPSQSLFSGESINIEYQVENKSFFRIPYLEINSNITKNLSGIESPKVTLVLEKKQSFIHKETVLLKRRGYYKLGEIEATIKDVFGFYSFKKRISSNTSLLVYPEIINLSTFKITTSHQTGEALVQNSVFQDKSRISSLREYREGDSVKAIHWKLSAKKDIPIVKDYETRGDTYATIFIDNYAKSFKDDIDRRLEDKAATATLSIVNYCLSQNIEVCLETQNHKSFVKIQGQQKSDLKPFLEALARFRGNGSLVFNSFLMSRIETLKRSSTVIIITPNFDKEIGALGIQLKMKNFNPLFIVITDIDNNKGFVDQIVEEMLNQEGIPIYILNHNTSIKEALEVYDG